MPALTFFDLFAGIGGFRTGLERTGHFRCIGHCEIDPHADKSYRTIHNIDPKEVYYADATNINPEEIPGFDLLTAGFPCQSFSLAGKRRGFEDQRGTLFFEIVRILKVKQPQFFLLENVPGLLSHDSGRTFNAILSALSELGYGMEWQVLNSLDFGVPQNRKRVYIVGYLDPRCAGKIFPFPETDGKAPVQATRGMSGVLLIKEATRRGYKEAAPGDSVDTSYAAQNMKRARVGRGIAYTLTTKPDKAVVEPDMRIRRLTPRECLRLQGFPEEQIKKLLAVTSDSQAYKQAGNAVTANVVEAVGKRLYSAAKATREALCNPTGQKGGKGHDV